MRLRFIFLAVLAAVAVGFSRPEAGAQTQRGYVKTKGRLAAGGKVMAGQKVAGVTIGVAGSNAVVSDANGRFAIPCPSGKLSLVSVSKQGYELADPEMLGRTYAPSSNELVIVVQQPEERRQDKLMAERKIRRTLEKQLQQKEEKIFRLQQEKKISQQKFTEELERLYEEYDKDQRLVGEMAQRYAGLDYDLIDDFHREVASLILEGELARADSLLNTRGSIEEDLEQYMEVIATNRREAEELARRQDNLEKSLEMAKVQMDDLAKRCYSKYEIHAMRHEVDSASYYLGRRAALDPDNEEWQRYAILYNTLYFGSYADNLAYYQNLVDKYVREGSDIDEDQMATLYSRLSEEYGKRGDNDKALDYGHKALEISEAKLKKLEVDSLADPREMLYRSFQLFLTYDALRDSVNSQKYMLKVGELSDRIDDGDSTMTMIQAVQLYLPLGMYYMEREDAGRALHFFEKFDRYITPLAETQSAQAAYMKTQTDKALISLYILTGQKEKGEDRLDEYLAQSEQHYGKESPALAEEYLVFGAALEEAGSYPQALDLYEKGVKILSKYVASSDPDMIEIRKSVKDLKKKIKQQ